MNEIMQCFFFFSYSLRIVPSNSIHVVTNDKISFFFMAEQHSLYIHAIFSLSIHPLMDF